MDYEISFVLIFKPFFVDILLIIFMFMDIAAPYAFFIFAKINCASSFNTIAMIPNPTIVHAIVKSEPPTVFGEQSLHF